MDNNDFIFKIVAELEKKGIKTGYDKLKKELEKDPAKIDVILNTSGTVGKTKGSIKKLAAELHNELSVEIAKLQRQGQNINFDLSVGDVEEVIQNVINHTKKLEQNFDSASAKAQKFLSQFNKKSGGTLINSAEYKAVQEAIDGLGNTHSIDDLNQSMNTLEITYNNMVSNLRNGGKSLNPFINAINEMAIMDETIKGIELEFEKLSTKPKSVSDSIKQLSTQQEKVNSYTIGTQEWADAYGQLQKMIQKVNAEISNLAKAKSANVATHILNTDDLDKQGKIYIQKISNTIEKTKSELASKLRNAGYADIEIKGVEDAKGKIKSLTATVTDATGAFKQLNFERAKIQGNGKAQAGFVQTDDVKVVGSISSVIDKVQHNLSSLKVKWEEQGVLVGDFKSKVEQLESSLASVGNKDELNNLKTQIQELKTEAVQIAQSNKIQLSIDNGTYDAKYDDLIAKTQQWSFHNDKLTTSVEELKSAYKGFDDNTDEEKIAVAKRWEQAVKSVNNAVKQMKLEYATDSQISSFHQKLQEFYDKNSATHRKWGDDLKKMLTATSSGAKVTNADLETMKSRLDNINNAARQTNKLGKSWFDTIRSNVQSYLPWVSMAGVIGEAGQQVRKMCEAVYDIDTAMTNLYKVTDETADKYNDFLDNSSNKAKELGSSMSDLITQTSEWAKLGFSLDESSKLAETSMIYSNVGEVDNETAVQDIVTSIKAFNIEASNSIDVVDKLNKLGNEFATDAKSLGEGLRNSASSMAVAGNDINQTLAILTGGGEITQNVQELGNGLRVVSMRLRGMKGELQSIGEEYEDIESISKIQTQIYNLTGGKVNIFRDDGSFKSTYEQLKEISEVYFNLTDTDQANLTEILFGKNRANQGVAILQAFQSGQIEKAYEAATNAAGSAYEEQQKWLESLEAKTQQFEAAFQSLSATVLDSDLLKWFVDLGTDVVSVLDSIIDKHGLLATIVVGSGAGITAFVKNFA